MSSQVAPVTIGLMALTPTGTERFRAAALGAFTALLAIAFLLLLVADQAHVAAGVL